MQEEYGESRYVVPVKRYENPAKTALLVVIATIIMIAVDAVYFPAPVTIPEKAGPYRIVENSEIQDYVSVQKIQRKELTGLSLDVPQPDPIPNNALALAKISEPAGPKIKKDILPPVTARAYISGKGQVVIIIDDMGMDRKHSLQAIDLPAPVTLAFLPYAPKLPDITQKAKDAGHELIIHVPMQPLDPTLDPGPLVLRDDMPDDGFSLALEKIFESFDGYVGINNHMGSKLTQNKEAMDKVMEALAERNLMFIDSKTISTSVAVQSAAEHGLAFAERDVFLDNQNTKVVVMKALHDLEIIAKRRGYAIAIGHPREATIQALKEWLPGLKDRGLTLVPVSAIAHRTQQASIEADIEPAADVDTTPTASSPESFGPVQEPVLPP